MAVVGDADIRLVRQEISLPSTFRAGRSQGRSVDADDGTDSFSLSIEIRPGVEVAVISEKVMNATKQNFEVTPNVMVLDLGTLAKEFESSVKAPRFADKRK